jgi:acyl-CoA reductase-like NAD-dependent aldehyde dehydrogenase
VGNEARFYIDGWWVEPVHAGDEIAVVDPATENEVARVAAASATDVESAVQAAHRAFPAYAQATR